MHDLTLAGLYSDRLAPLDEGRCVATGAAAEVLQAATLAEFYGVQVTVRRETDRHRRRDPAPRAVRAD